MLSNNNIGMIKFRNLDTIEIIIINTIKVLIIQIQHWSNSWTNYKKVKFKMKLNH